MTKKLQLCRIETFYCRIEALQTGSLNDMIKEKTIFSINLDEGYIKMNKFGKGLCLAGTAALAISSSALAESKKLSPNIIVVYIDDLGWTDTSVEMIRGRSDTRSHYYQTPNLQKFAKQGMTFSDAYASAPVCSPSRNSLLFGITPARARKTTLSEIEQKCVGTLTIPQALKKANPNYKAAHFGKWHNKLITPKAAGYDVTDGPTGNGEGDYLDGRSKLLPENDPKRMFSLTEKSKKFITQQVKNGKPFYLQLSHYAVHIWHNSLKKTREKYLKIKCKNPLKVAKWDYKPNEINESKFKHNWLVNYAAMIDNMDTTFRDLVKTIDKLGIADNTYIIFTSDNGGGVRGNAPLRGAKADLTEGGIRIPMIVRGPGVPADSYTKVPVVQWDFLPTFYALAGGTKPLPDNLDGGSLVDVFHHGNAGKVKRGTEALVFHFPWYNGEPESAIRIGDYKLLKNLDSLKMQLYNVSKDIEEKNDLSTQHPELVKEYSKRLENYLKKVNAETVTELRKGFLKNLDRWIPNETAKLAENRKKAAKGDKHAAREVKRLEGYIKWMKGEYKFTEDRIKMHENRK